MILVYYKTPFTYCDNTSKLVDTDDDENNALNTYRLTSSKSPTSTPTLRNVQNHLWTLVYKNWNDDDFDFEKTITL